MAGRVQRGGCRCEGYPQNQCPPHNTTRTHAQTAVCHRSVQPLTGKYLRVQRQVLARGPNLREVGLQETGRGEERKLNIRHRAGGLAGSGAQAQPQRRAPSQWPRQERRTGSAAPPPGRPHPLSPGSPYGCPRARGARITTRCTHAHQHRGSVSADNRPQGDPVNQSTPSVNQASERHGRVSNRHRSHLLGPLDTMPASWALAHLTSAPPPWPS